jgi:hypothetical protein
VQIGGISTAADGLALTGVIEQGTGEFKVSQGKKNIG